MSLKTSLIGFSIAIPLTTIVFGLLEARFDMVFNSLYTILCIGVTIFLNKKYSLFNNRVFYAVIVFIMFSVFAGRTLNLYSRVPYWDKFLHLSSGFILVDIGKEIYLKSKGYARNRFLKFMFILSFSIAVAGIWEIIEFSIDSTFGTFAQNGSLHDTMCDIIAGTLGATIKTALTFKKKDSEP